MSAFVIHDASDSSANYKRAISEMAAILSNGPAALILTLGFRRGAEVDCRVQVVEPCLCKGEAELKRLGDEASGRGRMLVETIQAISPSLKVRICRGREIARGPLEGLDL